MSSLYARMAVAGVVIIIILLASRVAKQPNGAKAITAVAGLLYAAAELVNALTR